jgi:diaminopimelate epimerase
MHSTEIAYFKMNGCGNDFILIDNREGVVSDDDLPELIRGVCRRRLSVGADGLILIENDRRADFKWRFYNSDGSRAEMCGNGARCAARFALVNGIAPSEMTFETDAGPVHALVESGSVKVKMPDPAELKLDRRLELERGTVTLSTVNTGVPHAVCILDQIEEIDVVGLGREIRYHSDFAPSGTNANFIAVDGDNVIAVRTYERGVEDETMACGTGCIASALVAAARMGMASPLPVRTRSGNHLTIHFTPAAAGFEQIYLEGDARIVSSGKIWPEAWQPK